MRMNILGQNMAKFVTNIFGVLNNFWTVEGVKKSFRAPNSKMNYVHFSNRPFLTYDLISKWILSAKGDLPAIKNAYNWRGVAEEP